MPHTYYRPKPDGGHELYDAIAALQTERKKERLMKQAKLLKKENYEGLKGFLDQIDNGNMNFVTDLEPDAYSWAKSLVETYEALQGIE
jgi:DNA replication protein DnaC